MNEINYIRNFSIIAHIDHGKSTLADRMLEITGTIEKRKMKNQVLDRMDLERERGITIKMAPVRMVYHTEARSTEHEARKGKEGFGFRDSDFKFSNSEYILNLIDTPGHVDFAYEVSRALKAVEGAVLLVDATQGVQAQTFSTLHEAQEQGLTIIPAVSKIDSPLARTDEVKQEVAELLSIDSSEVLEVSGKTGEGVEKLLDAIIARISPPEASQAESTRALVFDFEYSDHRGVIVYVRMFEGTVSAGDKVKLQGAGEDFSALEVGIFSPDKVPTDTLTPGSIGYVVTGLKKPGIASVGDTLQQQRVDTEALPGYMQPNPVVWASVYPESQDDFFELKKALEKLHMTDASLSFDEELSGVLGRGFRCGFLGMLHLEIIGERLQREFNLPLIITSPTVEFEVLNRKGEVINVYTPIQFPDHGDVEEILEPWVSAEIITPAQYVGSITKLIFEHEGALGDTVNLGNRTRLLFTLPLRELYRNFFDEIKSVTSGYASLAYEMGEMKPANVTRLDVLVGGESIPALARVVSSRRVQEEAESIVKRLHEILPRQQVAMKVQAVALGRILSSKTLKAFRKDVTAGLYGGDITRKRKVLERQKKGKKRLKETARANIPHDTFIKMMRSS